MTGLVCRGNDASDSRMSHDPFKKKLCPGMTIELRYPIRQSFRSCLTKQIPAAERSVGDHGDLSLLRKWQEALFSFTFHQRIIDLQKIELFGSHNFFYSAESPCLVVSDPHVTNAPLRLPLM